MAITRQKFSNTVYSGQAGLATTGGSPTLIHTSTTAANTVDEVHLWVSNPTATATTLTLHWSVTAATPLVQELPAQSGYFLIVPGLQLASGLSVWGSVGGSGAGFTAGFINRLTTGA
jgi:hypothetical protein